MRNFLVVITLAFLLVVNVDYVESIPPAWFVAVAAKAGVKLLKKMYYSRCKTRYVPSGINCPGIVYGAGWSRHSAQNSARMYASTFGDAACAKYVGHCQIYRWK